MVDTRCIDIIQICIIVHSLLSSFDCGIIETLQRETFLRSIKDIVEIIMINFQLIFSWELLKYIVLPLALWIVVRYLATYMISAVHYFTEPPQKVDPFVNGVKYPVSYWTEKGGRPYQEDRHQEMKGSGATDSSLYGVFDGHGGYRAAQYCKDYLLKCIAGDALKKTLQKRCSVLSLSMYAYSNFIVFLQYSYVSLLCYIIL